MAESEEELAALAEGLAEARRELEALQGQVADAEARAAHFRQQASLLQQQLEEARQEAARRQEELSQARAEAEELRQRLREATLRYREARLAARPELPAELVTGETLEEIDRQLEQAEGIVARLRERLEEEAQGQRFPAGAPPRRAPDLSSLSPLDKIRQGLQGR